MFYFKWLCNSIAIIKIISICVFCADKERKTNQEKKNKKNTIFEGFCYIPIYSRQNLFQKKQSFFVMFWTKP